MRSKCLVGCKCAFLSMKKISVITRYFLLTYDVRTLTIFLSILFGVLAEPVRWIENKSYYYVCILSYKLQRALIDSSILPYADPDRPKNDKASILSDTVQIVKDLTAQVNRLKAEYATLNEESREVIFFCFFATMYQCCVAHSIEHSVLLVPFILMQLTQEKNDLREEKASLKSDIENLNAQYQQRLRATFPWAAIDHSVVMHPPSYPLPVPLPMPIPPGAISMHPSLQPYPFFGNQNHGVIPNPCSTFVPYVTPNPVIEQPPTQYVSPAMHPSNRFNIPSKQDSRNNPSDCQGESKFEKSEASDDVTTDLELKTPGSTPDEVSYGLLV